MSNRVLLEAAFSGLNALYSREKPGNNKNIPFIQEQTGPITFGSHEWRPTVSFTPRARAHVAYVTGSHNVKVGLRPLHEPRDPHVADQRPRTCGTGSATGVPNQITMYASGHSEDATVRGGAFYAQDQWTVQRFTIQGGLRFDYGSSSVPEQQEGPSRFFPVPIVFPAQELVTGYRDLSLRGGLAWDVFGNGRTSVKVSGGKYIDTVQWDGIYIDANPMRARISGGSPPTVTRSWTDRNADFVPQCDFLNSQANGECGTMSNVNFGQVQTPSNTYDPDIMGGWGIRPRNYQVNVSLQQQVFPRVSVEVGYNHRWFPEFTTTDNRAVTPADYDPFSITTPPDPRLPDGGNYVISDLTNISNAAFGKTDNFITLSRNFGDVDELLARRGHEHQRADGKRDHHAGRDEHGAPGARQLQPDRRRSEPAELRGQVPIPDRPSGPGVLHDPADRRPGGDDLAEPAGAAAGGQLGRAECVIQPSLGRPLSGGAANVTVNLLNPGQMYGDRVNQLDLRVAKILRFGKTNTNIGIDIYNVTNSSVTLTYNSTYGTTWLRPTSFMVARWFKVTGQFTF